MDMIDLHVHSNFSDGSCPPEELVDLAIEKELKAFALTDHDTTAGVDAALARREETAAALEVVPGIELSTEYQKKEIHIVGLYVNHHDKNLTETAGHFVHLREKRNQEMIENFQNAGIPMTLEELQEGNPRTVITRAHFARHLLRTGAVKNVKEAFAKYLGEDCPLYVARKLVSSTEAISLIREAGGVPILAHPLHYHLEETALRNMVDTLRKNGLVGMEVRYSNHTPQDDIFVGKLAREFDLLPSGGSDFHGTTKPDIQLGTGRGSLSVPLSYLEDIREARPGRQSGTAEK